VYVAGTIAALEGGLVSTVPEPSSLIVFVSLGAALYFKTGASGWYAADGGYWDRSRRLMP
jgi:hypothetical protein